MTDDETTGAAAPDEVIAVRHGLFGVHGSGDTSGYGGLVQTVTLPA
ncbi:MAG: NADH-quinone oxidoreductase subunit C, partial [Gordonia polyisoprenivorans]|nr:NADH-quinone oxidoreductase subunit C [Gordonia polyisoprenivorans]